MMIIMGFGITYGIGTASIVSRKLGEKKYIEAKKTISNSYFLVIFTSILIIIVTLPFLEKILLILGATKDLLPFALDYGKIILWGTFFQLFAMLGNNIARSEGNAKVSMNSMLIGAITNIILDWYFVINLKLGIKGAAYATIIGMGFQTLYLIIYLISKKQLFNPIETMKMFDYKIIKEIIFIGFPSFARNIAGSLMTLVLNNLLKIYGGEVGIAAFGIIYRLLSFIFMPIFGIIQGLQPILGYNYGAKKSSRVKESLFLAIKISSIMSIVGFIVIMLFSKQLISIFSKDFELINFATPAMRMVFLALPIIGFQIVVGGMYQALGKPKQSLFLSLLRQIIILIPLTIILSKIFGLNGIFVSFPISDFIGAIISLLLFLKEIKIINEMIKKEEIKKINRMID
jgi:putative MATE family efflux protein